MKKAGASFVPVAVLFVFAALILTFSVSFTAASTSASSICDRFPTFSQRFPSCRETPPPPPPADVCPNVPGTQTSGPCADEQCLQQGGTWNGASCVMPPPPPPPGGDTRERGLCDRYSVSSRGLPSECVPSVRITYPNGGEIFTVGDVIQINWESNRANRCSLGHSIGPDTLDWIATDLPGTQKSLTWTVKSWGSSFQSQQQKLYILCSSINPTTQFSDYSDDFFTVDPVDVCPNVPGTQGTGPCADDTCVADGGTWNGTSCDLPFVRLTYPNGGETLTEGDEIDITWEARGVTSCTLAQSFSQASTPQTGNWKLIDSNVDGTERSYHWVVKGSILGQTQGEWINIICAPSSGGTVKDYSDNPFWVIGAPECSDGSDNDSDGFIDYAADPNCTSVTDNSERSPIMILPGKFTSSFGQPGQTWWGKFLVDVTDEPFLLGPISFTITTTGMDSVTRLLDVHLDSEFLDDISQSYEIPLINGIGTVTFPDPIYLNNSEWPWPIDLHATIPLEERSSIPSGAQVSITAKPASEWTAVRANTQEPISLESVPVLNLFTWTILNPEDQSPAQCVDGWDNDGDDKKDFPVDDGCSSYLDDSEASSVGSGGGAGGGGGGSSSGSN